MSRQALMFCTSLLIIVPTVTFSADAARVAGDLKVDGLYFSGDPNKTVLTKPSDFQFPWTFTDPDIYFGISTGNVGIGTTNPTAKLTVSSTGNFLGDFNGTQNTGGLRLLEGSTFRSVLGYGGNGGVLQNALSNSTALYAATGGLHLSANYDALYGITLTPEGTVGIGTTNPFRKLEVIDTTPLSNATAIYADHSVSDGFGTGLQARGGAVGVNGSAEGTGSGQYHGVKAYAAKTANSGIGATIGGSFEASGGTHTYGLIGHASTANSTAGTTIGGKFEGTGGLENYGIQAVGDKNYFRGSVGIGTMTPGASIHVMGAGFPGSFMFLDTAAAGQDSGIRLYENGSAKTHIFWQATPQTLNLYGSGYSGLSVASNGSVGIGTTQPNTKLQVLGDIRVGTSGTNGCVQRFDGTFIAGTCSSDVRLKRDIRPFGPVLEIVARLQPVHYFWRAEEFPERHFGNTENSGLIAQDVERVIPEMVSTDEQGFKQVNYSELPYLMLGAVRELNAENQRLKLNNDKLKQDFDALKARLEEIEKMLGI